MNQLLLSCLLVAASCGMAQADVRTEQSAVTPAIKNPERHAGFLERIKQDNDIGILFLGDSITDFWPGRGPATWREFASCKPANFGISGDRTEHLLWRITNGELEGIHPKVVVIMIGTNNIGGNPADRPEWAAAGVKKIVETVRAKLPEAKILLLGVFPRGDKKDPHYEQIKEINRIISKLGDGAKVHYLDIGKVFLDANGEIPLDVMPDRLHPSAKGYELWYGAMQPTLDRMMKN